MNNQDDYLWDPNSAPDPAIATLEQQLKPFGAAAKNLAGRNLPLPRATRRPLWSMRWLPLAAAAMFAGVYFVHIYRLSWTDSNPWPVTTLYEDGTTQSALLRVGERITTTGGESVTLDAARIGKVVVAPNSVVTLIRTEKGRHRIELERGRLHAKVWAPPNYFAVAHGSMRFVDMGCEFDLSIESPGKGTLSVKSGWVVYNHDYEEILVPEGYLLAFNETSAQIPVRSDAAADFRRAVHELETQLALDPALERSNVAELVQQIVTSARNEDYFSIFALLRSHPQLAKGALYPRLAIALQADPNDELHRARWISGDPTAREEWWRRWPKQPKTWWVNWRDAF